jgi:hypothetical protein
MSDRHTEGFWVALSGVADRLAAVLPGLVIMFSLVLLGLLLAWIAGALVARLSRAFGIDRHLERWNITPSLRRSGVARTPSDLLGAVVFWMIFVLFAGLGIDSLSATGSPGVIAFLIGFLPPLFAAILVFVVGWLVANFVSQGLLIAAVNAGLPEARLLARAVYWGIVLFAGATGRPRLRAGRPDHRRQPARAPPAPGRTARARAPHPPVTRERPGLRASGHGGKST